MDDYESVMYANKNKFSTGNKRKTKTSNYIVEFDLSSEERLVLEKATQQTNIFPKTFETNHDLNYEITSHKISNFDSQVRENKNDLTRKVIDIYSSPLINKTALAYEKFRYGSGRLGDGLSAALKWLGKNVIKMGHNTGSIIRSSFHMIGDVIGNTINKTEDFVGNQLIKSSEKIHQAGIDLQRTSHSDSEQFRQKFKNLLLVR